MKRHNKKRQRGAAHLVLVLILVIGLVGALGYLAYSAWQKQRTNAGGEQTLGRESDLAATKGSPITAFQTGSSVAARTTGKSNGQAAVCSTACYHYVGGYVGGHEKVSALGASVDVSRESPRLSDENDGHTLVELAVGSDIYNYVEVGITVDKKLYGDKKPRLFVFHWVKGVPTCYNKCGFVQVSNSKKVGSVIGTDSAFVNLKINFNVKKDRWEVWFHKQLIGYYPASLWKNKFKKASIVQVFGEVATHLHHKPRSAMGNRNLGGNAGAARVKDFELIGSETTPKLTTYVIGGGPTSYRLGNVTTTSFSYGGPGF